MHRWFGIDFWFARSLILLAATATACSPNPPRPQVKKPVPVHVVEVEVRDMPRYIEAIGTLRPVTQVQLRPQVSGILNKIMFTEGQVVIKNQPLFAIDPVPYEIALLEAKAQKQRDEAALDSSRKKLNRYEGLSKKDLISKQEWDELNAEVSKHAAQLQADDAKIASASLDLKNCSIVAPIHGKTGRIAFHAGSLVTSSQSEPLVSIACIDCLVVEFSVTEQQFRQLREANGKLPMQIYALGHSEITTDGIVTFSNFGFDDKTGLLQMCGIIENHEMRFLPGQNVKVKLPIAMSEGLALVPDKAVKINQEGPYVYRVSQDCRVELCQVRTGEEFGDELVIAEGINKGDLIVTEGHLRLYPGAEVEAIRQDKELP